MRRFAAKLAAMRGDKIEWAPGEIRGIIHGPLPNKLNSRKLVRVHGRMLFIKEQAAIDWLEAFNVAASAFIDIAYEDGIDITPEMRLSLTATVYQKDMRRDLDIELLCDALQKSGVIQNDRAIWEKHAIRKIDKENPRVEFVLRPFSGDRANGSDSKGGA